MGNTSATRGAGLLEPILAKWRAKKANALMPEAARAGKILDVGCGSFPLFLHGTRFAEKHGIDRLVTEERRAQLREQGITLHNHDVITSARLPFEDNTYDVVTMLAVLEHIPDGPLQSLLQDIHRVLKPGGRLILTTPAYGTAWLVSLLVIFKMLSAEEIDEHQPLFSRKRIRTTLRDAGFSSENIEVGSFECGVNLWARARKQGGA